MNRPQPGCICRWLWIFGILCMLAPDTYAQPQIQVLSLHSYHQNYGWTAGQQHGFERELNRLFPDNQLQIHAEYLDTKRRPLTDSYQATLASFMDRKYAGFTPNLIYVTDDNALRFALAWARPRYRNTPIIFSGINDLSIDDLRSTLLDGVFEQVDVAKNLTLIKKLRPESRQIVFVGDGSPTDMAMRETVSRVIAEAFDEIEPIFVSRRRLPDLLEELQRFAELPRVLTTIGGIVDTQDHVIPIAQIVQKLSQSGRLWLFAMEDTYLAPGVIGGWVNSSEAQGIEAAQVAARMYRSPDFYLRTTKPFSTEPIFDYLMLKKHQIHLSQLPSSHRLLNEPRNFFYLYRNWVLLTLGGIVALLWIIVLLSLNVRRRKRAEKALESSRTQLYRLIEDAPDAIYLLSPEGQIIDVNDHALENLGYTREQLVGKTLFQIDKSLTAQGLAGRRKQLDRDEAQTLESVHQRVDGTTFPVDMRISRCEWDNQSALLCFVRDISARKEVEQQLLENEKRLNYLAYHDPLTNLPNRLLFSDRLEHALHLAGRQSTSVGVLFFDLDRFKYINDSLGHDVGDAVLKEVAHRLQHAVRETDTVARLGGDEFVVLVEGFSEAESLIPVAEKIEAMLKPSIQVKERQLYVAASIGIAVYPHHGKTPQKLMKAADVAMYKAKESDSAYCFYQTDMDARANEFLFLESSIRQALEAGQFTLYYQPQFQLNDNALTGFEALLRWDHPTKGLIPPAEFIPPAEESGLIIPLGEWVLREACRQQRLWLEKGLNPVPVAVNVSPRQFHLPDWHLTVSRILREFELPADLLELEITENLLMRDSRAAIDTLDALAEEGVSVAIDDFGSGYSSMAYLKRFSLNKLKIDQSFIADIGSSLSDTSIVRAVITLGWSLGLKIVAEGIETEEQLRVLKSHGCHQGQGYHLGYPSPAEEVEEWLKTWRCH